MKKRSDGFLRDELISHGSEQFDYIAELHEYLWRFIRVVTPGASGSIQSYLDEAIAKAESLSELAALRRKVEESDSIKEKLRPLWNGLSELLSDDDLDDDKLREASEGLLPNIHDALLPWFGEALTPTSPAPEAEKCQVHPEVPSPFCPRCDEVFEEAEKGEDVHAVEEKVLDDIVREQKELEILKELEKACRARVMGRVEKALVDLDILRRQSRPVEEGRGEHGI